MKEDYLIPPAVKDLCEALVAKKTFENERANYYRRVAAIKEACEEALLKAEKLNKVFTRIENSVNK